MPEKQPHRQITSMGGVGLVMFHLGRLGHDFVAAPFSSPNGDIWAQIGARKIGIEVKTTRQGDAWHINRDQIGKTEVYCLVRLVNGACFVLLDQEMRDIAQRATKLFGNVVSVGKKLLPSDALNGWSKLACIGEPDAEFSVPLRPAIGNINRVRRKLSDGTFRYYEYPRHPSRLIDCEGTQSVASNRRETEV